VIANLAAAQRLFDPRAFRVIQLDDGFQRAAGDWETNAKFPHGHRWLTDHIRAAGFIPGLWLAFLSSVAAYAALAIIPFPGLRQMALFSSAGLAAAFGVVIFWYPFLDRGSLPRSRFAQGWARGRALWPVLPGRRALGAVAVFLAVCAPCFWRVTANDSLRSLQNADAPLIQEHLRVSKLIGLPSPAQMFLVQGRDVEELLQREEVLREKLDLLVRREVVSGYVALSTWVPSKRRQHENAAFAQERRTAILEQLRDELELEPALDVETRPLDVDRVLASAAGEGLRALWLGTLQGKASSLVALHNVTPDSLAALSALHDVGSGVRFVDRTADISAMLKSFRVEMTWLLAVGYVLVFALLWPRFRLSAWRAIIPAAIGSLALVALLGALGLPFQLFHVLALWLVLGMGVDYGIFLLEHPSREDGASWFAVGVGAASTLLSFGLLGVSKTPALAAFGMAMAVGITVVWITAPAFCTNRGRGASSASSGRECSLGN
jgi:predicted exporter